MHLPDGASPRQQTHRVKHLFPSSPAPESGPRPAPQAPRAAAPAPPQPPCSIGGRLPAILPEAPSQAPGLTVGPGVFTVTGRAFSGGRQKQGGSPSAPSTWTGVPLVWECAGKAGWARQGLVLALVTLESAPRERGGGEAWRRDSTGPGCRRLRWRASPSGRCLYIDPLIYSIYTSQ